MNSTIAVDDQWRLQTKQWWDGFLPEKWWYKNKPIHYIPDRDKRSFHTNDRKYKQVMWPRGWQLMLDGFKGIRVGWQPRIVGRTTNYACLPSCVTHFTTVKTTAVTEWTLWSGKSSTLDFCAFLCLDCWNLHDTQVFLFSTATNWLISPRGKCMRISDISQYSGLWIYDSSNFLVLIVHRKLTEYCNPEVGGDCDVNQFS